jgi:hypothetical protein
MTTIPCVKLRGQQRGMAGKFCSDGADEGVEAIPRGVMQGILRIADEGERTWL